jgi:hypothetical protein
MANYRSPFSVLPDEHMRLVGIIAAHWEFLDVMLQRTLAEVMEHDHGRIALLTESIPFRAKTELLMAYARPLQEREPQLWDEFTKVHSGLQTAYGLRNRYVHARWKAGALPELPMRVVTRIAGGKFTLADEETSVRELEVAAQTLWEAGEALRTFFQKFDLLLIP